MSGFAPDPDGVAKILTALGTLQGGQRGVAAELGQLTASQGRLEAGVEALATGQATLMAHQEALETNQAALVARQEVLETNQAALEGRQDALAAAQITMRTELMDRMDRLQDTLTLIRDDISVNIGAVDAVHRANDNTRDLVRQQAEQMSVMWRQLKALQARVRDITGDP